MYLKSIEVQGFKSFANRLTFDFHNGITGIVGPNGSGKSNVSDAVRWVLGEQSAKQLRGSNMQDVIFAGTENRKPLSFAYVAITLDNSDHVLDIAFDEVTIARRVYRSGESEYLINGSACRLKDVQELFYDTGIGKEGYSIIGQGQIEKILNGKPEERRELFDEAAGIVKYKRRKLTAQKKLESERENLVRVKDILSELERQVGPLEKQAEKARIYLKLKEELKASDVNYYLTEAELLTQRIRELEQNKSNTQEELSEANIQFQQVREEYEAMEEKLALLEQEIASAMEGTNQNSLLKGKLEGQIEVLREQIKSAELSDEIYKNRVAEIEKEKLERRTSLSEYENTRQKFADQQSQISEKRTKAEQELKALQSKIRNKNEEIEQAKTDIIELLNRRSNLKSEIQRADTLVEQLSIRKAQLTQQILQRKSDEDEIDTQLSAASAELDEVKQMLASYSEKEDTLGEDLREWRRKHSEIQQQKEQATRNYHQSASRMESLKNIAERYDGYGNSIRKVLEQKDRTPGLIGVVADLIKVDKKYEISIETALGGRIQNIVTKDEDTAKSMIRYLKENKLGRATFLPLTAMEMRPSYRYPQALKEKGVIGLADTLVVADEKYRALFSSLLGNTIVVDHLDNATVLARKYKYALSIVTLEGESLAAGGSMTGGAFRNSSNLLGRNREIEELEIVCSQLSKELESYGTRLEEIEVARSLVADDLEELKHLKQAQQMQEHTISTRMDQLLKLKEDKDTQFERVFQDNTEIEKQIREIRAEKENAVSQMEQIAQEEQEIQSRNTSAQSEMEEHLYLESSASKKIADIQMDEAGIYQKLEFVHENIRRVLAEIEKYDLQILDWEKEAVSAKEGIEGKLLEIQELQNGIKLAGEEVLRQEELTQDKNRQKEELRSQQKKFFERREEISARITSLDKEMFRLASQQEKSTENLENRTNYMWEEYELTPNSAKELRSEEIISMPDLKGQITDLKDKIRRLGEVNVNAIEDYKDVLGRYEFLHTQHQDLVESEEALLKIIEELDTGMRNQFTEKFTLIQKEFDKTFRELFGGGKGTLELMEDEDLLESGVRIIAQPPGKKLQNMVLLSGGEKSLTAIALLFAIQNLKPSPFCLLDEIEAALDDSNVGRFADYLHKLTKHTQFIVITHRRGTMAASDRLYGITMQEKGVSTLVSVNLIEQELDK